MAFELKQSLNLKLSQQLVMTPQLQQAIRLLQLSRTELIDAIQGELEANPVLEEELRPERSQLEAEAAALGKDPKDVQELVSESDKVQELSDGKTANEIDWDQVLEQWSSSAPMPGSGITRNNEDFASIDQTVSHTDTLCEHLVWQLNVSNLVDNDREIAFEIIGGLGDDGFLRGERPVEEIAIRLEVSVDHVERVLGILQRFDPVGVATRSLQECLKVQMFHYEYGNELAMRMIDEFLPDMENRNYQAIAKKTEKSLKEVAEALQIIQSLEPRPARNFGATDSIYITPDIYVNKIGDEYVIVQNEDGLPMLRISNYYKTVLKNGMNPEAKAYVQERLRSAEWLIRSIHQRKRTIYKVMESILKFQATFFEKGVEHLKPLILRQVAEDIGMHESTISRVTSNKYVHTPRGIYELKYFFNSSIGRPTGEDNIASMSVKHKIKQIIDIENEKRPYSDQAIVGLLRKEDIGIARRTVAKYRESMGIMSSSKRRKIL